MHSRPHPLVLAGVVPALAVAVGVAAVPAASAAPAVNRGGPMVSAVVVVRPGVSLPLRVPGGRVVHVFHRVGSELVRAPMSALLALRGDARVAGVSPDRAGRVAGHAYGHDNSGSDHADSVYASDGLGPDAGDRDTGRGVNVALLDTGVSDTAALSRSSGRITDGVDVSRLASGGAARTSGQFTDGYGHGTFLASLIAGGRVSGSDGNALGVAPAARIVVVKVADAQGATTLSQVLAGMDWVAAHARAIQVVNIALAVDRPTKPAYGADPLTAAVEHVRAAGVLVVAAVGNTPGQVGDPGMDPQSLTVGAADMTSRRTQIASFSGSGVVAGVAKPDVVASGVHLLGLVPAESTVARENPSGWQSNGLFRGSGTSEATAVTSGVAAAWLSDHADASPSQAKAALRSAADSVGSGIQAGAGLIRLTNRRGHDLGESDFDGQAWQAHAWENGDWASWLASSWSGSAWSASSWSASTWSASSWSASSWSASSWSASSWSASSWSASSWSASSWSASSWSAFGWGDDA
ncbi:MAG: serine protease AprX [Frankiaceae bacterium]|nr:serine protease AprX [Frankiaceae bacterium]